MARDGESLTLAKQGFREIMKSLFMTTSGRITVTVAELLQVIIWLASNDTWWELAMALALTPVILVCWAAIFQFVSGAIFALWHARRPRHSYAVLNLKDGRQRRGMVCLAPCCLRSRIKRALRTNHGRITWSLDDGSDDEQFERAEIENWYVIPVDNPDPHGTNGQPC